MSLDAHSKHLVPRLHRHSLQDKLHGPEGMPGSHGAWQSLSLQLRGLSPAVSFRLQVACGGRWNSGSLFPFPSPVFLEPVLWRPCGFPLQTAPSLPSADTVSTSAFAGRVKKECTNFKSNTLKESSYYYAHWVLGAGLFHEWLPFNSLLSYIFMNNHAIRFWINKMAEARAFIGLTSSTLSHTSCKKVCFSESEVLRQRGT